MSDRLGTDENWRFENRVFLALGIGTFVVLFLLSMIFLLAIIGWWFW